MRYFFSLVLAALLLISFNALGQTTEQSVSTDQTYTVKSGDTLWELAGDFKGDPML